MPCRAVLPAMVLSPPCRPASRHALPSPTQPSAVLMPMRPRCQRDPVHAPPDAPAVVVPRAIVTVAVISHFAAVRASPTVSWVVGQGATVVHLICLLRGHRQAVVPFSSGRLYCARCGLDLGSTAAPGKASPPPMPPTRVKREAPRRRRR
jgi:hypothetical protein